MNTVRRGRKVTPTSHDLTFGWLPAEPFCGRLPAEPFCGRLRPHTPAGRRFAPPDHPERERAAQCKARCHAAQPCTVQPVAKLTRPVAVSSPKMVLTRKSCSPAQRTEASEQTARDAPPFGGRGGEAHRAGCRGWPRPRVWGAQPQQNPIVNGKNGVVGAGPNRGSGARSPSSTPFQMGKPHCWGGRDVACYVPTATSLPQPLPQG
jgi:hypothetical protein